jgi:hypothetical protein
MIQNRLRTEEHEPMIEKKAEESVPNPSSPNFNLDSLKLIPYIIFFGIIGILYIANRHYTHKQVREITQLRKKVEELRVNYTTLKAEVMAENQQTEISRRVSRLGIGEPSKNKILVSRK